MGDDLVFFMSVYDTVAIGLGAMQAIIHPKMSRKPKKGYYVRGEFVAEGSELDLAYKRELKGSDSASKTDLKRESEELQQLGEQLLTLRSDLFKPLPLTDKLVEALAEAKRITNFEGKRRQMQFIGKLMRQLEPEVLQAVRHALELQRLGHSHDTEQLHQAELWRDRLIDEEDALTDLMAEHPDLDAQRLRALIRNERRVVLLRKDPRAAEIFLDLLCGGKAQKRADGARWMRVCRA